MWKIRKLDEQLFQGAAAKIHAFLDIEPLMPPGRLRLSKLLGRPVMDELNCNCTAATYVEELGDMDCEVHGGQTVHLLFLPAVPCFRSWRGLSRDAPNLVGVRVISTDDKAWGQAWYEKEGCQWPEIIVDGEPQVHPVLDDLVAVHCEFVGDWEQDMGEYDEPDTSDEFAKCPICAETYIGDFAEVVEIDGRLYATGRRSG